MTDFIVDYYPIIPNQWIRVEPLYFGDKKNPDAQVFLNQYYLGIDKGRLDKSGIVPYNNSWFAIVSAETIRDAIIIFWDKLEIYTLQQQVDREEKLKRALRNIDKMERNKNDI